MEIIHLSIVEDDPLVRESLVAFLGEHPGIELGIVVDSVEGFLEALELTLKPQVDEILLDIGLPGMSGLEGIRHIRQKLPDCNIVMLTTFEEEDKIFKALCAGAVSYLSKRTPLTQIQEALFTIHRGGAYMSPGIARKVIGYFAPKSQSKSDLLSDRQKQIVQGVVDGLSYKLIADKYMISINTVRDHIKKIYQLLEINSKAELIRKSLDGEI
ncbi:MAG: response regulator transcription factor [Bacteroidota bacterium]